MHFLIFSERIEKFPSCRTAGRSGGLNRTALCPAAPRAHLPTASLPSVPSTASSAGEPLPFRHSSPPHAAESSTGQLCFSPFVCHSPSCEATSFRGPAISPDPTEKLMERAGQTQTGVWTGQDRADKLTPTQIYCSLSRTRNYRVRRTGEDGSRDELTDRHTQRKTRGPHTT